MIRDWKRRQDGETLEQYHARLRNVQRRIEERCRGRFIAAAYKD